MELYIRLVSADKVLLIFGCFSPQVDDKKKPNQKLVPGRAELSITALMGDSATPQMKQGNDTQT